MLDMTNVEQKIQNLSHEGILAFTIRIVHYNMEIFAPFVVLLFPKKCWEGGMNL